ncbi:hypothetical protein MPSEU_000760900 [Mayamaea pseudoterrestris]|nr:hypothetical protein MPSEU_000760900 [Mayamaea pseudoterrestris]
MTRLSRSSSLLHLLPFCILLASLAAFASAAEPIQLYGINYSNRQGPDWDATKCKSDNQVLQDLQALRGLTKRVRILSLSDCNQGMQVVQAAKTLNMQVLLGLWVSDDEGVFAAEVATLQNMMDNGMIDSSTIVGVTVGSEAVYRKDVSANVMVEYFDQVKQVMQDGGMTDIPVSICDIDDIYIQYPQLFAGDQVVVNSFPYWESQDIDAAVTYLEAQMDPILAQSNGKSFILGETGWPSDGTSDQTSVASPANQAQYLMDFYCRMDRQLNWNYYWFTGIDNDWRSEQDQTTDGVESHFGLLNSDLTLKDYLVDFVFTCPDSNVEYSIQLGAAGDSTPTASVPAPSPTAFSTTTFAPSTSTATATPAAPAAAPTGRAPTSPTTAAPTRRPASSPTAKNAVDGVTTCSAYKRCFALELQGECCPTANGVFLKCCEVGLLDDGGNDNAADVTASPATSPTSIRSQRLLH